MFAQVSTALAMQRKRFDSDNQYNNSMHHDSIEKFCIMTPDAENLLEKAFNVLRLSMRGYHKIIKVARTIADLSASDVIHAPHIQEAIMYRSLDQYLEQQREIL